jgi:hypothetical protein
MDYAVIILCIDNFIGGLGGGQVSPVQQSIIVSAVFPDENFVELVHSYKMLYDSKTFCVPPVSYQDC